MGGFWVAEPLEDIVQYKAARAEIMGLTRECIRTPPFTPPLPVRVRGVLLTHHTIVVITFSVHFKAGDTREGGFIFFLSFLFSYPGPIGIQEGYFFGVSIFVADNITSKHRLNASHHPFQ